MRAQDQMDSNKNNQFKATYELNRKSESTISWIKFCVILGADNYKPNVKFYNYKYMSSNVATVINPVNKMTKHYKMINMQK